MKKHGKGSMVVEEDLVRSATELRKVAVAAAAAASRLTVV